MKIDVNGIGHRIRSIVADAEHKTLALTWDDGTISIKNMAPLIIGKRVFKPLADEDFFMSAHLINDGRALAWNEDIDLCADSLWLEAHPQENPFTPTALAAE